MFLRHAGVEVSDIERRDVLVGPLSRVLLDLRVKSAVKEARTTTANARALDKQAGTGKPLQGVRLIEPILSSKKLYDVGNATTPRHPAA